MGTEDQLRLCRCGLDEIECRFVVFGRTCYGCGANVHACNGFTKAGDLLEAAEGERKPCDVRELCGLCVLRYTWTAEGELEHVNLKGLIE